MSNFFSNAISLRIAWAMQKYVAAFRARLPSGANAYPTQVYLTGQLAVENDLTTISLQDVERADTTVLPIALLILLLVFGICQGAKKPGRRGKGGPDIVQKENTVSHYRTS